MRGVVNMKDIDFSKNCLISIGVILLYFFWPSIMGAFWETFGGGTEVTLGMILYNVIGYVLLVGILILIYHKSLVEEWKIFCANKKENLFTILKYTILLFFGVILFNMLLQSILSLNLTENEVNLYQKFQESPLLMIGMVTIYYPFVEVIVFQKTIRQVIKKPWLFIFISAVFFGYFNVAFTEFSVSNVIGSLQYVLFNAVLAFCYYKKDTIVVPVGIKMLYNFIVTILSIL